MSDSPNNGSEQPGQNPIPINVRPTSRRTISFPPPQRVNFDSIYDPPVTAESQAAHGHREEQNVNTGNTDPTLQPIEDQYKFLTTPRRIKKGVHSSHSPRLSRSQSQYGISHSLTWNALKNFNEELLETPSTSNHLEDYFFQGRNVVYDEPSVMTPGEGGIYSVIVDDGSLQKRRISLTSEHSRHDAEQTSLLHDYDDNSDSDIEDIGQNHNENRYDTSLKAKIRKKVKAWLPLTQIQKNVIKCALAYFLASLFTFIPALYEIVGLKGSPNIHLIATVAVFFNPAKTVGGMYEAVFFSIIGGLYGSLVGICGMASAVWFKKSDNYILNSILGPTISVVVWCGGSMFVVAFLRAKLNKPTFNSACSLANIIIFVVVTKEVAYYIKEFSMYRIIQVTKIILIGICISFLVSVCVWPVSASKKLKIEIGRTLGSFRLLLKLLTKAFLIDDIHYTDQSVQTAIKSYQATFTSLKAALYEASHEFHNVKMQRQLGLYKEVVDSLQRLAQYLGGLRSCCGLQWEIIKDDKNKNSPNGSFDSQKSGENNSDDEEEFVDLGNLLEIIQRVGPSMKSLAFTCKQTISHLQNEFTESSSTFSNTTLLHQNLRSALDLFEKSQTRSFTIVYCKKNDDDSRPNEEVFLTYFFVFNLQEFTKELMHLVDLVDHIQSLDSKGRRRKWWKIWDLFTHDNVDKKFYENVKQKFPENTNNLFNTIQTPIPKTLTQKFTIKIWKSFSWFRQFEFKYALKTAISAAILSAPAFISETKDIYRQYRGEWACISMMVVMVPTIGGANLIGAYRAGGTLLGSTLACIIYTLFPDNGLVMSILGFFIALGCYYMILCTKHNRMGQFMLLTYNLVALYKLNLRHSDEENLGIIDIARYRTIAVITGIIWGVYVTTYWWPYEARVELRKGLSQLFINMSWLYHKLVAVYSDGPDYENDAADSPNSLTLSPQASFRLTKSAKEFVEMELFLQLSLIKLKELLSQTPNEPRLKGPFPVETYNKILMGCQNILDKLLSMRTAVTKEEWHTSIQKNFIMPISKERKDLIGNVLLYFYILAGALKLKTPLPPYLPPAEKARKNLIKKIRDLPVVKNRVIKGNDVHYTVYYAFVLVLEDIIRELEKLGEIMKELFGCIGGNEFDDLFRTDIPGSSNSDDDVPGAPGAAVDTSVQKQQGNINNGKNHNNIFNDEFGTFAESSNTTAASQDHVIDK